MERAAVEGLELEYELLGAGDPVVLIHWGVSATWAEPLLDEPALADHFELLRYHRAGYGASSPIRTQVAIADHSRHCRILMDQLELGSAHVVGHSSSALIALQLAVDFPAAVRTLALLEPARPAPQTELQAQFRRDVVEPAVERFRAGDRAGAVETWALGVFGPDYRERFERGLPGAIEQCIADASAFFGQELPALQRWSFTQEDASRISQPVLAIVGENTAPSFPERVDLLCSWLPDVERVELPRVSHLLHVEDAQETAAALASFYIRRTPTRRA
jgi:pimeloyl-ACP methyl ester carboxylesterase